MNAILPYFVYLRFFLEVVKKPGFIETMIDCYDFDHFDYPMIVLEIFLWSRFGMKFHRNQIAHEVFAFANSVFNLLSVYFKIFGFPVCSPQVGRPHPKVESSPQFIQDLFAKQYGIINIR